MITNKNNTPSTIYLKEDGKNNFYEKDLDNSLPGVVKYVREDYIPNDSEMIEFAKSRSFYLDDRLIPYDRDNLRAMAWLDGYRFAKRNMEPKIPDQNIIINETEKDFSLNEFIARFSHNNRVWIENKNNYVMGFRYCQDDNEMCRPIMDWQLKYTDIENCKVICIKNVIRYNYSDVYTIKIDTNRETFMFDETKVADCPLWLKNKIFKKNFGENYGESTIDN